MEQSESIKDLTAALICARAEFKALTPDKENPHFRSRYASLNQCIEVSAPALGKMGLTVTQWLEPGPDGMLGCTTQLQHASGEWQRSTAYLPVVQMNPQATGSAITYARRYGYCAALGLAPDEDDDANAAAQPAQAQAPAAATAATPTSADNMRVTWGKAKDGKPASKWHGMTFAQVWAEGSEGHQYLHWVAESSNLNPATKAAARAFIDRAKAQDAATSPELPEFATAEQIAAFRLIYEQADLPLDALGETLRKVEAENGGVPLVWLRRQENRVQALLEKIGMEAEYADVTYTPDEDIGY